MATKTKLIGNCPIHGEYYMDASDSPCPSCEDGECLRDEIDIGTWNVVALIDDDGQLNIYITNRASNTINEIETGQGDGENEQYALRFTTPEIEQLA